MSGLAELLSKLFRMIFYLVDNECFQVLISDLFPVFSIFAANLESASIRE